MRVVQEMITDHNKAQISIFGIFDIFRHFPLQSHLAVKARILAKVSLMLGEIEFGSILFIPHIHEGSASNDHSSP